MSDFISLAKGLTKFIEAGRKLSSLQEGGDMNTILRTVGDNELAAAARAFEESARSRHPKDHLNAAQAHMRSAYFHYRKTATMGPFKAAALRLLLSSKQQEDTYKCATIALGIAEIAGLRKDMENSREWLGTAWKDFREYERLAPTEPPDPPILFPGGDNTALTVYQVRDQDYRQWQRNSAAFRKAAGLISR